MDLTKSLRYIHILYLNTIGFKAQSLWSRVKIITNEYRTILKIGIMLKYNYTYKKNSKNVQ